MIKEMNQQLYKKKNDKRDGRKIEKAKFEVQGSLDTLRSYV